MPATSLVKLFHSGLQSAVRLLPAQLQFPAHKNQGNTGASIYRFWDLISVCHTLYSPHYSDPPVSLILTYPRMGPANGNDYFGQQEYTLPPERCYESLTVGGGLIIVLCSVWESLSVNTELLMTLRSFHVIDPLLNI